MNGYALDSRQPSGYCKVEVREGKGKINTYIQGLKPLAEDSLYYVYFISAKTDQALGAKIAVLNVDSKGHAENVYEFDPDNVDGTGLTIEDFNVAAIVVKGNTIKSLTAPIVGYRDKSMLWKSNFIEISKKHVKEEILPEKELQIREENKKDEVVKNSDPVKNEDLVQCDPAKVAAIEELLDDNCPQEDQVIFEEIANIPVADQLVQETNPHKVFNDMVNKFYAEMEELEKYKVLNSEDVKALDLDLKVTEAVYTDELSYMFTHNDSIVPFEKSNKEINWIKIAPFEIVTLNLPSWTYIKHQFINACWKKHKYLILGRYIRNNAFRYMLGVPDYYNENCAHIANELGFKNFVSYRGKTPQKEEKGYWIMEL